MPPSLSRTGWFTASWILATSLQYGWHISALNQIQAALTCSSPHKSSSPSILPPCIPMDDLAFSIVTASFTAGGLLGSITANRSMDALGLKVSIRISTLFAFLGSALMTVSASVPLLVTGRFLIGISSGLGLCVVPSYLSEISPPAIKGSLGVLNQLGIVTGILLTQALGIILAAPTLWRAVPLIAAGLALSQFLLSAYAVNSPAWLVASSRVSDAKIAATALWGDPALVHARPSRDLEDEEEAMLPRRQDDDSSSRSTPTSPPTLRAILRPPLRRALFTVCLGMIAQQISGINAVLYYSNAILGNVLPGTAAYVSLGVTIINALMTIPPIYLIERIGRRALITLSTLGALVSLCAVGYSIDTGSVVLASVAVLTYVASFAIGLGPVPFVIIPDISPYYAVSFFSSIALSLNWITNFVVGMAFLPLRNYLADGNLRGEGRVFYVFAGALFVVYMFWTGMYQGR